MYGVVCYDDDMQTAVMQVHRGLRKALVQPNLLHKDKQCLSAEPCACMLLVHAWWWCMHGGGACMHGDGACMVMVHAW